MFGAFGLRARGLAAALTFAALAVGSGAATAASPPIPPGGRVRVLQSSTISPRSRRCLTRLREELAAGGLEVTVSEFGAGGEARWMVDPPSFRDGAMATLTLVGDPDVGPAELWIVNGAQSGHAVVRRLLVPAGAGAHDDEVLAIRTLEFLRASALELAGEPPIPSPPPVSSPAVLNPAQTPSPQGSATPAPGSPRPSPPEPRRPSAPPATSEPPATSTNESTAATASATVDAAATQSAPVPTAGPAARGPLSLELGVSLIESSRTVGPAILPVARLRAEWPMRFETRLTVAGWGTQPRVAGPGGSASVGHLVGLVELRHAFRRDHALRPAIGLGGGVLRVNVEGTGSAPYQGLTGQKWVGLVDLGVGLTARLGRLISVAVELHGQLAAPYPTIRFSQEDVARIGQPALFTSVTLVTPL